MRYGFYNHLILLGLCYFSGLSDALADSVRLHVTDEAGLPLEDAVIMAPGKPVEVNPEAAVMDQIGKKFEPHVLVIEQGRSVRFPNSDDIRHHVYSFSKPKPFEIKLYSGMQQAPVVFEQPGIVALGCNIHDWMIGYIVVSDTASAAQTDANGNASLDITADIAKKEKPLRVWHPRLLNGTQSAQEIPLPAPGNDGITVVKIAVMPKQEEKPSTGFGNRFRNYAQ